MNHGAKEWNVPILRRRCWRESVPSGSSFWPNLVLRLWQLFASKPNAQKCPADAHRDNQAGLRGETQSRALRPVERKNWRNRRRITCALRWTPLPTVKPWLSQKPKSSAARDFQSVLLEGTCDIREKAALELKGTFGKKQVARSAVQTAVKRTHISWR